MASPATRVGRFAIVAVWSPDMADDEAWTNDGWQRAASGTAVADAVWARVRKCAPDVSSVERQARPAHDRHNPFW